MAQRSASGNATGLRIQERYITDHTADGVSIFSSFPSAANYESINPELDFWVPYTNTVPPDMNASADIGLYQKTISGSQPSITIPNGTVLRVCNFAPGSTTAMHRTVSLDYGIVVEGEVELVLDSGDVRLLKVGDIAVQRGTMHAWRTPSKEKWSRMVFILQDAKPFEVGGKAMTNDYGGIEVQSFDEFEKSSKDEIQSNKT